MTTAPEARGRIDAAGALASADEALLRVNAAAGGRIGAPLALPAVAEIVRLARRLGITVSRPALVRDGPAAIDLWVRAEPEGEEITLAITGWHRRPARPIGTGDAGAADFARAADDWRWECDGALRLTALSPAAAGAWGGDTRPLLGEALTRVFAFGNNGSDDLPLLAALAEHRRFGGQIVRLRGGGGETYRLSGVPLTDGRGRFAGFRGAASRVEGDAPSAPDDAFARKLDDALRGPLGRIIANADALGEPGDEPLRPEYADYATDIASAGRHLLSLVDDLVDLHAIERPDFAPEREPIDLGDLGRRAGGLLAVRAAARDVRIERPGEHVVAPASGEFRRVLQILVNLIGNAVRYAPPGSAVTIEASGDVTGASITVADNGPGIAPADQARVFEKFERVDPHEPGGTGLGLYIARRLARAMGGDLSLQSEPGAGARFTLTLPGS